jgi:hypothetical protein
MMKQIIEIFTQRIVLLREYDYRVGKRLLLPF